MSALSFIESTEDELLLINVVEGSVKAEVKKLMQSMDVCCCDSCYLSACAIALNAIKPHYVTTSKGALFKKIDTYNVENQTNVIVEATKAVLFVKEHPHHDVQE